MHEPVGRVHFVVFEKSTSAYLFQIAREKSCDYLYKLHSVNIQDDKSWAFSETVQNISKITYTASRFSLLTSAKFQRTLIVTLQHKIYYEIYYEILLWKFIRIYYVKFFI